MYYTLDTLTKSFLTTGIIIIDNSQYGLFSKWSRLTGVRFHEHPKVRVIENHSNKYVNPSWNQGLAECFGDNTIIMNDDVFKSFYNEYCKDETDIAVIITYMKLYIEIENWKK